MELRLDYKYLDELIEKYGNYPSVLFSIGKFHRYRISEPDSIFKLGFDFKFKRKPNFYFILSILLLTLPFILPSFLMSYLSSQIPVEEVTKLSDNLSAFLIILFIISLEIIMFDPIIPFIRKLDNTQLERSLTKYLKNIEDLDKETFNDIISNVTYGDNK
jgi:hypothetical protein